MSSEKEVFDVSKALYVDSCGNQLLSANSGKLNTYSWADYHILYVTEGTGYIKLGAKRIDISAGSLAIFLPWQCRDYGFHRHKDSRSYYIHFNGEACEEIIKELKLDGGNFFQIGMSLSLTKLLDDLSYEFKTKNQNYEYMCHSYLLAILTLISRKLSDAPRKSSESKKRINEICKYIYENCNKIDSINSLAQITHLSESRFSHLFSETIGVSPQNYLLRARVDMAKELLANTDLTVGQISSAVGFNDQNYFSRAFKRFVNMSPTDYRQFFGEIF